MEYRQSLSVPDQVEQSLWARLESFLLLDFFAFKNSRDDFSHFLVGKAALDYLAVDHQQGLPAARRTFPIRHTRKI